MQESGVGERKKKVEGVVIADPKEEGCDHRKGKKKNPRRMKMRERCLEVK